MRPHRVERPTTRNVGDPSSKYGYDRDGSQFNADMQAHKERGEYLWSEFVKFMHDHDVTPDDLRDMFIKYHDEYIA